KPIHQMSLPRPFYLCDREVTVAQFLEFINDPDTPDSEKPDEDWPSYDKTISATADHPVQNVSWFDAILYCNWLNRREGREPCYERSGGHWKWIPTQSGYRLPTEAEWEYACRAGTTTDFCPGDSEALLPYYAVTNVKQAERCGSKRPNAWGLFDMHGNVYEWCQDWFEDYPKKAEAASQEPEIASSRVYRGGSWYLSGKFCR
ncbi:MAG: formylglycine-generating enzyme family protein, partial [Planctomycetaceae bacterium]|nr:formylglycine-generating enzyme family protein [Planctomycetaceae bacterium]